MCTGIADNLDHELGNHFKQFENRLQKQHLVAIKVDA